MRFVKGKSYYGITDKATIDFSARYRVVKIEGDSVILARTPIYQTVKPKMIRTELVTLCNGMQTATFDGKVIRATLEASR